MLEMIIRPIQMFSDRVIKKKDRLNGFYKVTIQNRTKSAIWLAKNMNGDLYDVIPPGASLRIRIPIMHRMEFYAYQSSDNLQITGLNYYDHKIFEKEEDWIIK